MSGDFQSAGGFDWKRLRESIRENDAGAYATGDAHPFNLPELLDNVRRAGFMIYEEDGKLHARPPCLPPNPMRTALKTHEHLLRILVKEPEEITEAERQQILANDIRFGFTPPNDFEGARRALIERGNLG